MLPLLLSIVVLFWSGCAVHAGNFYAASHDEQDAFCRSHNKELNVNFKTQQVNGCASAEEKEALISEYTFCQAKTMADPSHPYWFVGGWDGPLNLHYQCMNEAEYLAYKQREATLEAARIQAGAMQEAAATQADAATDAAILNSITQPVAPIWQPSFRQPTTCTSQHSGSTSYTTCY